MQLCYEMILIKDYSYSNFYGTTSLFNDEQIN